MRFASIGFAFCFFTSGLVFVACGARTDLSAFDTGRGGAGSGSGSSASSGNGGGPFCSAELCNGKDDDCNGIIDDNTPNTGVECLTGLEGACSTGLIACLDGALVCVPNEQPTAEICENGLDDDCNGVIDNGCVTPSTGCSDGTREGFLDIDQFPNIAGCSGGFGVPGLLKSPTPSCGFQAGNSGPNPQGVGCSAADLCSLGFHVCKGAQDVASRSPTGCDMVTNEPNLFFATRQGSTGCAVCTLGVINDPGVCTGCTCAANCASSDITANDLFGCGTMGGFAGNCDVLDRTSGNACGSIGFPWSCGGDGCDESLTVTKLGPEGGGVLCCAD